MRCSAPIAVASPGLANSQRTHQVNRIEYSMSDQNEPKKVENKVNVRVALSWAIPWFAGMLFTMGFSPYPSGLDFWGQLVQWVFYFFGWPFILGRKLGAPPVM